MMHKLTYLNCFTALQLNRKGCCYNQPLLLLAPVSPAPLQFFSYYYN